jgi:electron transfer flavoprotein alpha subunit
MESASFSASTAAQQLGGSVTGLIVGGPDQLPTVVERAKKYIHFALPTLHYLNLYFSSRLKGLSSVLHSSSPLLEKLLVAGTQYTHVVSAHSSSAKSLLP